MDRRKKGNIGEETACLYLKRKGCEIIKRNFTVRGGEIDIIFKDGDVLVFCEVKSRATSYVEEGWQAVSPQKQRRILKAAVQYMVQENLSFETSVRFDVIVIFEGKITHYKNAFGTGDYI